MGRTSNKEVPHETCTEFCRDCIDRDGSIYIVRDRRAWRWCDNGIAHDEQPNDDATFDIVDPKRSVKNRPAEPDMRKRIGADDPGQRRVRSRLGVQPEWPA